MGVSQIMHAVCMYVGGGGHCIGDCTPTRDRGQSEVKRSRRNFEAGQAVKLGIGGSLRTVKLSPGHRWSRVKARFSVRSRGQA